MINNKRMKLIQMILLIFLVNDNLDHQVLIIFILRFF